MNCFSSLIKIKIMNGNELMLSTYEIVFIIFNKK